MAKAGTSKNTRIVGSTISLQGCGASGAYAPGPDKKKKFAEQTAEWAPELVWMIWRREKSLAAGS